MLKHFVIIAVALSAGAAPARGQHHEKPHQDTVTKQIVGVWDGKYYSDHSPENAIRLTIAHDSTLKGTMELTASHPVPPIAMADLKVVGTKLTWTQQLMGMTCNGSAALLAGSLKGEIACGQGTIGFLLAKK